MMCTLSHGENRAKLAEIKRCLRTELRVEPRAFRAGRWGFGPSVAMPLAEEGFSIDCSVSPFIDWTSESGPDFSDAPNQPYRFQPSDPFTPLSTGTMVELPTTIGFLAGDHRRRARARTWLERSAARRLRVVGILDRAGLLARRWLSPETSTGETMIRLVEACVLSGQSFLQVTFHSCTLLPGATPFVRDSHDRKRFFDALTSVLAHCSRSGFIFRTLSEAARHRYAAEGWSPSGPSSHRR